MHVPAASAGACLTCALIAAPLAAAQAPDAGALAALAGAYVVAFEERFASVVAEEHYIQELRVPAESAIGGITQRDGSGGSFTRSSGREEKRTLVSDLLLVQAGDGQGWLPFRDVYSVNGSPVRDREDRLVKLFLESPRTAVEQAAVILAESARYNLGSVNRNVNLPILALLFVHPANQRRFEYSRARQETVTGIRTDVLVYSERERPTLIHTNERRDLPVQGRMWVEAASGRIWKTELDIRNNDMKSAITVTYRLDSGLGVLVPARMEEFYETRTTRAVVFGTATYRNYRRFQVNVKEVIGAGAARPGLRHH